MANCIRCGRKMPGFAFGKKVCQWCVHYDAIQRGEIDENAPQPVMAAPWVRRESSITLTNVILGANVVVFIAMIVAGSSIDFTGQILAHFGANFGPYTLSGDWWRLLTYMFLHGGIFHIAMNMWCLWNIGSLCESLYGRATYAAIYVITGVAGGLASIGWNPEVLSVGASGALFGLTGALIASFYLGEFSLSNINIKSVLSSLVFWAGFSLFFGSVSPGIDNACHVGGLVSGLALGALIARLAPQSDAPMRRVIVVGAVGIGVVLAGFGVERWRGEPMKIGRALSESGPEGAIQQLQSLVRQRPNSPDAHFALGQEYFNQGRYPEAEVEFKRVLELKPRENDARFDLGLAYLNERRLEDANTAFLQMVAQDANSANGHAGLGMVLAEEEKYQNALDEFKTAARLNPQMRGLYVEIGNACAGLKMFDEAIAAYLEEQKQNGDNAEIETALADVYQAKGMTQQAQSAKEKASQFRSAARN